MRFASRLRNLPLLRCIAFKYAILSVVLGSVAVAVPPVQQPSSPANNSSNWGKYAERGVCWGGQEKLWFHLKSGLPWIIRANTLWTWHEAAYYPHISTTTVCVRNMITFSDSSANWPLTWGTASGCALHSGLNEFPISEIKWCLVNWIPTPHHSIIIVVGETHDAKRRSIDCKNSWKLVT